MAAVSKKYILFEKSGVTGAFVLNGDSQLLNLDYVVKVPQSPSYLLGLAYYNGQVLTVLDSAVVMALPAVGASPKLVIILSYNSDHFAWPVDQAGEIIQAVPDLSKRGQKQYIKYKNQRLRVWELADILSSLNIYD